jgi:amino-acid N-acetyltransferase
VEIFRSPRKAAVIALLKEADLPTTDITDDMLESFFGCGRPAEPSGVIGLEIHGAFGLLRSLVVEPRYRGTGCGKALVDAVESYVAHHGIESI